MLSLPRMSERSALLCRSLFVGLMLPLLHAQPAIAAKPGAGKAERRVALRKAMLDQAMVGAKRMTGPFQPRAYDDKVSWREGPITIFRTGTALERKPLRYLWFHGAGQGPDNELVTRMANASHELGLNLEIISLPYGHEAGGMNLARALVESSPDKVLVGGHSMGGVPSSWLAGNMSDRIAGVVTVNAVEHALVPGVPALHFIGENDGGRSFLGRKFDWNGKNVEVLYREHEHRAAILREADHSGRWRERGDGDKARAAENPKTWELAKDAARTLKDFLGELKIGEEP